MYFTNTTSKILVFSLSSNMIVEKKMENNCLNHNDCQPYTIVMQRASRGRLHAPQPSLKFKSERALNVMHALGERPLIVRENGNLLYSVIS